MGVDPEKVNWSSVKPYAWWSAFAKEYGNRRDQILRAKNIGQILETNLPGFFLAWARRNQINYPPEVEEAVTAFGHQVADWKARYDDTKRQFEEYVSTATSAIDALKDNQEKLGEENAELRARLFEVENALAAAQSSGKELHPKTRQSLLKLVLGMAIACYKYDRKASKSDVPRLVTEELAQIGIAIDEDTVRARLKEAAETITVEQTEIERP